MKKRSLPKGILSMAAVAATVICRAHTNLYNAWIPGFAERNGLVPPNPPKNIHVPHETNEICLWGIVANSTGTDWFITTNTAAKQPRWDGVSTNVPLSEAKACSLALAHMRFEAPEVKEWKVQSVEIRTNCEWGHPDYPYHNLPIPNISFYQITFSPGLESKRPPIWPVQIVLFDGTVVPRRTKERD